MLESLQRRLQKISSRSYAVPHPPYDFESAHSSTLHAIFSRFNRVTNALYREYLDQHKVAVVCSARSGSTKALGTTNLLLRAASEALRRPRGSETPGITTGANTPNGLFSSLTNNHSPDSSPRPRSKSSPRSDTPFGLFSMTQMNGEPPSFNATVDLIRSEHMNAARSAVRDPEILKDLEAELEHDCDQLRSFLFAAQVCPSFLSSY